MRAIVSKEGETYCGTRSTLERQRISTLLAGKELGCAGAVGGLLHRPPLLLVKHQLPEMLAQRIYGLALGYEDLNDHEQLRSDPAGAAQRQARSG